MFVNDEWDLYFIGVNPSSEVQIASVIAPENPLIDTTIPWSVYPDHGAIGLTTDSKHSFITDAVCSSDVGFTPTTVHGGDFTYFCDAGYFIKPGSNSATYSLIMGFDAGTIMIKEHGIFCVYTGNDVSQGGRLAYL